MYEITQRATVRWHIAVYDFGCSYIPAIAIGLTVASLQWLPKGLYLLLILGFGIVVQLQIPLFEHALKPYVNKVAA